MLGQRPKSFSKYGQHLQRNMRSSPVKPSSAKPLEIIHRPQAAIKPTFETVNRNVKSPFILFHSKDTQNLNYKVKFNSVDPHEPAPKISRTVSSGFIDKVMRSTMPEFSVDKKEQLILTHRDLHSSRKKMHHLDFTRKPKRVLGQIPDRHIEDEELRFNNFEPDSIKQRSKSVHSFNSYTKRKDLYAQESYKSKDGSNSYQIDLKNIRKRWSSNTIVPFDKLAKTIKVRSDRDCQPWLTKLNYKTMTADEAKASRFDIQSRRKPNQVHSKYPMRICV